ncbi:MAG: carbohydrate-binding family 9-like protein [Acidobacteria bacterium]|nr:carbohydrate-binding family 9-like protein [Acidobacteriota bacterium]MBV9477308.1 carbohydrate-binding family 9-like protein [Acidobacteriota bacterium]
MTAETLVVPRAAFDFEEPWATPPECTPVRLRAATDASAPRLATSITVWFDDAYLTVLFCASDDRIEASHLAHDAPLYEEDAFELFLAPERLTRYFEIEVSPRGTIFDAAIDSPDGVRQTMSVDREWNCEGLFAAVRTVIESNGTMSVDTVVRVPFAALGCPVPSDGDTWRANFFRIDRHPERGDEYSAWQPTMRVPADFHVADAFGTLRFKG